MIHLFYLNTLSDEATDVAYKQALNELPSSMQEEIGRLKGRGPWKAKIAGRLLLKRLIRSLGYADTLLQQLDKTADGKPCIPGFPDFSISHSHGMVVCALNTSGKIGFDAELIRPVKPENFSNFFGKKEMAGIQVDDPAAFFKAWTAREAVVKADGRGMKAWNEIIFDGQKASLGGRIWHLTYPLLDEKYVCCCCSASEGDPYQIKAFTTISELV